MTSAKRDFEFNIFEFDLGSRYILRNYFKFGRVGKYEGRIFYFTLLRYNALYACLLQNGSYGGAFFFYYSALFERDFLRRIAENFRVVE